METFTVSKVLAVILQAHLTSEANACPFFKLPSKTFDKLSFQCSGWWLVGRST
jgi:hypothetical protein